MTLYLTHKAILSSKKTEKLNNLKLQNIHSTLMRYVFPFKYICTCFFHYINNKTLFDKC